MFEIEFKTKEKPLTTRVRGKRLHHFISVPSIREVWGWIDYFVTFTAASPVGSFTFGVEPLAV